MAIALTSSPSQLIGPIDVPKESSTLNAEEKYQPEEQRFYIIERQVLSDGGIAAAANSFEFRL